MKTKLEMAHEYAMVILSNSEYDEKMETLIKYSWIYADAMQAEADKRLAEVDHKEEWQPDWSQAPEWANWWVMDENKNTRWIYSELEQPYTSDTFLRWFAVGRFDSEDAPNFSYKGDWRDSLRKRPQ